MSFTFFPSIWIVPLVISSSPATIRNATFILRRFTRWMGAAGVHSSEKLRGRHLVNWQEALSARLNGAGKPLKARSVNKEIEVVKSFLAYLSREGIVPAALAERMGAWHERTYQNVEMGEEMLFRHPSPAGLTLNPEVSA